MLSSKLQGERANMRWQWVWLEHTVLRATNSPALWRRSLVGALASLVEVNEGALSSPLPQKQLWEVGYGHLLLSACVGVVLLVYLILVLTQLAHMVSGRLAFTHPLAVVLRHIRV